MENQYSPYDGDFRQRNSFRQESNFYSSQPLSQPPPRRRLEPEYHREPEYRREPEYHREPEYRREPPQTVFIPQPQQAPPPPQTVYIPPQQQAPPPPQTVFIPQQQQAPQPQTVFIPQSSPFQQPQSLPRRRGEEEAEEEDDEEEDNGGSGLLIGIIIFILIVVGGGGYYYFYVYKKNLEEEEKKKLEEEQQKQEAEKQKQQQQQQQQNQTTTVVTPPVATKKEETPAVPVTPPPSEGAFAKFQGGKIVMMLAKATDDGGICTCISKDSVATNSNNGFVTITRKDVSAVAGNTSAAECLFSYKKADLEGAYYLYTDQGYGITKDNTETLAYGGMVSRKLYVVKQASPKLPTTQPTPFMSVYIYDEDPAYEDVKILQAVSTKEGDKLQFISKKSNLFSPALCTFLWIESSQDYGQLALDIYIASILKSKGRFMDIIETSTTSAPRRGFLALSDSSATSGTVKMIDSSTDAKQTVFSFMPVDATNITKGVKLKINESLFLYADTTDAKEVSFKYNTSDKVKANSVFHILSRGCGNGFILSLERTGTRKLGTKSNKEYFFKTSDISFEMSYFIFVPS